MTREQIIEDVLHNCNIENYKLYNEADVKIIAKAISHALDQQDEPSVSAEEKLLCYVDYISALVEYVKLINEELDEVAVLAHTHGWRTSRFNEGVEMREKLNKCAKDCLLPQQLPPKT